MAALCRGQVVLVGDGFRCGGMVGIMANSGSHFSRAGAISRNNIITRCRLLSGAGRNIIPGGYAGLDVEKILGKLKISKPDLCKLAHFICIRLCSFLVPADYIGIYGFSAIASIWFFPGSIRPCFSRHPATCLL